MARMLAELKFEYWASTLQVRYFSALHSRCLQPSGVEYDRESPCAVQTDAAILGSG
jgi:hypothetical protein